MLCLRSAVRMSGTVFTLDPRSSITDDIFNIYNFIIRHLLSIYYKLQLYPKSNGLKEKIDVPIMQAFACMNDAQICISHRGCQRREEKSFIPNARHY